MGTRRGFHDLSAAIFSTLTRDESLVPVTRLTRRQGHVKLQLFEREKAMKYLQEAMTISKELEDTRGQAYCYMFMAQAYTPSGPKDAKGREYAEHALALATQEQKVRRRVLVS